MPSTPWLTPEKPFEEPSARKAKEERGAMVEENHHGQFQAGNTAALKHGAFSRQVRDALLPEQAEVLAALAEHRQAIEQDLGGGAALSVLAHDLVSRYLELSVIADHLGGRLVREGPLTPKGNQRAALTAYLGVVDRLHRLAVALGLERRTKRTDTIDAVMTPTSPKVEE